MVAKKALRAVAPDEKPSKQKPATIKAAVEAPERDLLVALRTKVAAEIDAGVPAHTLAPLMKQLRELDKEIRAMDARDQEPEESSEDGGIDDAPFDPAAI